jgi:hypothetical protein
MMLGRCVLALVISVGLSAAAAADCALMGLAPKLMTPAGATLAPDGGIVVGAESVERDSLRDGDVAVQEAWRFVVPMGTIEPAIEVLAPGLAVYRASVVDALELCDDAGACVKTTRATAPRTLLAAPKIKSIKYDAPLSKRRIVRVEVVLDGPPPPGVTALVLADAKGAARSWGPAVGSVFYPYLSRDCLALPNGTVGSAKGDKVTLFWVDDSGRRSARTPALTIR